MGARGTARHEVLVSFGRSSPGDGGIYEFSSQLALRIARAAPVWRERWGVAFSLQMRAELHGRFGDAVGYYPIEAIQRVWHRTDRPVALWHSTHQMNKLRPPVGCSRRLVTVHDLNYLRSDKPRLSVWRHDRQLHALLSRADAVATVSAFSAADVRRHLGWTGPLEVIHNGARDLGGDAQRPLFDPDPARPFLFHLSRMSPSKNPQAILDLARAWPEMDFVLCGPPSDDAKALAAKPRPANVRFFLGIDDAQKTWAYAHCAGFLFPSLAEGFGLPPIEAMHFGKPVFLARRTCLPEIGGDAADYFDDFAPAAMRAVVERGLARHAQDPGRAGFVKAHAARFDWDVAAARYLALYARLLGLATDALPVVPAAAEAATAATTPAAG